jgi:thioesterase domain-containing protein
MGGDSLNAVALFVEIEKIFGKPLPLYTLLGAPTVERLARALAEQHSESAAGPLVPIQPHGSKYPFFFVPGGTGEAVGFAKLIPFLGEDQPFLAFEPREDEGLQSYRSMTSITANYVRAMRQVQPAGPYLLGGACIGGKVALAMAQQLKREGETVGALIMLDSRPSYDPERASVGNRIVESMKALLPYRLRFMLGRVRPKLIHLRTLSWSERLPYILKKRRGWQGILAQSRSDYVRAVVGFMPPPYAGDVHMLASAESYRTDPTLGWRDIICGQLAVQIVPGDHSNYLTQHLDDAGRTLSRWLNEAQGPERRVSAP